MLRAKYRFVFVLGDVSGGNQQARVSFRSTHGKLFFGGKNKAFAQTNTDFYELRYVRLNSETFVLGGVRVSAP